MISTPKSREELLVNLIRIPSITGSNRENDAAVFVYDHLSQLKYYRENPSHLVMLPTQLEGNSQRPLHSVVARMMAPAATPKTVVFIAHYDVVEVDVYGDLAPYAFEPYELARRLNPDLYPPKIAEDIRSGNFIFGRGSMDMKCGLALEMELLRDFDDDRALFDVNIVVIAVADEENTGCGMRGAARYLARLKREEGLEYIAGIDTEASDAGLPDAENQLIFMGTMGKLMPAFYCLGVEAHVGNYYRGLSAALLSSHIVTLAEGSPALADPHNGACQPSWICLNHKVLSEGYSVTLPKRSVAYFNCFATTKTPAAVMDEMRAIAAEAAQLTTTQLRKSYEAISELGYEAKMSDSVQARVLSIAEIYASAAAKLQDENISIKDHIRAFLAELTIQDLRDRGIAVIEELVRISGEKPPLIAVGFLPPYNPPMTSLDGKPKSNVLLRAVHSVITEAKSRFGVTVDIAEFFAGLSDMSFMGVMADIKDMRPFVENCPGGDDLFCIPIEDLLCIDMPVMNIGPCGYDAHRQMERLDRKYSLEILPELIVSTVRNISKEWDKDPGLRPDPAGS